MLSKIKIAIGGFATAAFALLLGLLKYQSNRTEKAEDEAEGLKGEVRQAKIINELHEDSKRIEEEVRNESEEDLRAPNKHSRT